MVDKIKQLRLLDGAVEDYRNGSLKRGKLVHIVEALLNILEEPDFNDRVFDALATLDEIYAYTQVDAEYDFERDGRPIVDNALS